MTHDVAAIFLANDIAETIFPDNSLIRLSIDDSQFVYGKKVQIPQSGAIPTVTKNRTVYPLPVARRVDTLLEYDIDEYSTDQTQVGWTEQMVAPYGKTDSVIRDHKGVLETSTTTGVLHNWSPTDVLKIVRTTGAARPASAPLATGTRKEAVRQDIINLSLKMDLDEIPQEGRKLAMGAQMFHDLLKDTNLLNMFLMGQALQAKANLQELLGFEIIRRSGVLRYTSALARKDYNVVGVATDHSGSLAWHPNFVRAAIKGVEVFLNPRQAAYQADMLSALSLVGSSKRYANGLGVYALVEDVAV